MLASGYRLAVHGLAVEIKCEIDGLRPALDHDLGEFAVPDWPDGFVPVTGSIRPFERTEVLKCLSASARRIDGPDFLELYEEQERFWAIDERWGMTEINLLKGSWRSWILPGPMVDSIRCAHASVVWPMAQLLRSRGLHLLPACAVARGGKAFLILSPFSIEPEMVALVHAGFRVIGQAWTAVREEQGKIELLHMPGHVQRPVSPRFRGGCDQTPLWVDLAQEHDGIEQRYGFCSAVLVVEPGRRAKGYFSRLNSARAAALLKSSWPIAELHPQRRHGQLATRLSQRCECYEVALSRSVEEFVASMTELASGSSRSNRAAVA